MWVYINSEPGLFTVGFYDPTGKWHPDSDHDSRDSAARRIAFLNGGSAPPTEEGDSALSALLPQPDPATPWRVVYSADGHADGLRNTRGVHFTLVNGPNAQCLRVAEQLNNVDALRDMLNDVTAALSNCLVHVNKPTGSELRQISLSEADLAQRSRLVAAAETLSRRLTP